MGEYPGFDFDNWLELARDNPQAFEEQRLAYIDQEIGKASEETRRRMYGLQWQVDCVRHQAKTPLAACLRISGMMWDTVLGDRGLLQALGRLREPQSLHDTDCTAAVIHLPGND